MESITPPSSTWPSPSSLQVPPKPKPQTSRPPKLRASCDACAASKVRCSKDHPICVRCLGNGLECIYGPSRKHGKPGRVMKRNPDGTRKERKKKESSQKDGTVIVNAIRTEPVLRDADRGPCMSRDAPTDFKKPTLSLMELETPLPFKTPAFKDNTFDIPSPLETPLADEFGTLQDYIGGDSVQPLDLSLDNSDFFSDPSGYIDLSIENLHEVHTESIATPSNHSCFPLACSTLRSLHFDCGTPSNTSTPTSSSTSFPFTSLPTPTEARSPRSLDNVLERCQSAVQTVVQLLGCPCSAEPSLAMLYCSITSKLISWYQAAAGIKPTSSTPTPTPSSPSSSSSSFAPSPGSDCSSGYQSVSSIKFPPLQMGNLSLDEEDQEALRRQLLLRHLSKVGKLVEALANWGAAGEDGRGAEFLYDAFGGWLKSQLFRTVKEVQEREL